MAANGMGLAIECRCSRPLREGGCYPPEDGFSWTDGELALPARFFANLNGAFALTVDIQPHGMRYPLAAAIAAAA